MKVKNDRLTYSHHVFVLQKPFTLSQACQYESPPQAAIAPAAFQFGSSHPSQLSQTKMALSETEKLENYRKSRGEWARRRSLTVYVTFKIRCLTTAFKKWGLASQWISAYFLHEKLRNKSPRSPSVHTSKPIKFSVLSPTRASLSTDITTQTSKLLQNPWQNFRLQRQVNETT